MFRRWKCVVVSTWKRYILWAFRRGINDVNADVTNKLILSSGLQHKPCFKFMCVCFPSRLLYSSKKGFFRYCCSWCCCCVDSLKKIHWETFLRAFLEGNCAANETSLQMLELWNEIECTFCVLNYIRIQAQSGQFAAFSSIDFTISLDVCFT